MKEATNTFSIWAGQRIGKGAADHIEEIAAETGVELPCYSNESTKRYKGHILELFYDESSYLNGFKCFVTGFGTYSGCSFECAVKSAKNAIESFNK